jgi:hypothetical protein
MYIEIAAAGLAVETQIAGVLGAKEQLLHIKYLSSGVKLSRIALRGVYVQQFVTFVFVLAGRSALIDSTCTDSFRNRATLGLH